ncbi:4-hydroxyphenylacetate 3-hydroxylase N-terminal domain-containing protein [Escherichia coli]
MYGEQVKDVTTHPAFRNAAASVAQLYDALHKPEMQFCAGTPTPAAAAIPINSSAWRKCRRPAPAT